jgi:hypothetical protein
LAQSGERRKLPLNNNREFAPFNGAFPQNQPDLGVDKLQVFTREFTITDTRNLCIVPNAKPQGQEEAMPTKLFPCAGKWVEGSKAFHNADPEQLSGGSLSVNISQHGLIATFNPSKILGRYSGELASVQDCRQVSVQVETYLQGMGIMFNPLNAKLNRIDFAKDRQMSDQVFTYSQALSLLRASRMKEQVQYPDGMRLGNRQTQGIFYDKGLELKPAEGRSNLMRGEMRLLTSDSVSKRLHISTLSEFTSLHQTDIRPVYANYITKDLYHDGQASQLSFNFMQEVEYLRSLKGGGRNAFKKWVMIYGIEILLCKYTTDGIRAILSEVFSRNKVKDYMDEINTLLMRSNAMPEAPTLAQKFAEVKDKFVA